MREIRTSGSMSGDGKRDQDAPGVQSTRARPRLYPRGQANGVRGSSIQDARRSPPSFLNQPGVVEPYVEHGERAQRSDGRPITCFDCLPVRKAGWFHRLLNRACNRP